jgi:hypothetical protein
VLDSEIHESEGILVAAGADALAVADVHTDGGMCFVRAVQQFAVAIAVDCCHIPNREGRLSFVVHLEASPGLFKELPVLEDGTAKHALQVIA